MESINKMKRTDANGKGKFSGTNGKRQFSTFNFQLSILLLALLVSGCKKEDSMDNPKADSFNGTVTAVVENGAAYNSEIGTVYALYEATINSVTGQLTGQTLGNGQFTNGGFTVSMSNIRSESLKDIQTFFSSLLEISAALEYSNPDARLLDADFYAITSGGNYLDYFIYTTTGSKRTVCLFVYVDSDATVKGKNVSVALLQGWNRIYWTPADKKVVSKAPGGMKWYFNNEQ